MENYLSLLHEANGRDIARAADFQAVAGKLKAGETLRLLVQRGDNLFYAVLRSE